MEKDFKKYKNIYKPFHQSFDRYKVPPILLFRIVKIIKGKKKLKHLPHFFLILNVNNQILLAN